MEGQHTPCSFALSASKIKTNLAVGGSWSGQQAAWIIVLIPYFPYCALECAPPAMPGNAPLVYPVAETLSDIDCHCFHSFAASCTADSIDSSLESLESLFFIFNLFFKSLLSERSSLVSDAASLKRRLYMCLPRSRMTRQPCKVSGAAFAATRPRFRPASQ